ADKAPDKRALSALGMDASLEKPKFSAASRDFRTSYEDLKDRLTATAPAPEAPKPPEGLLPAGQHPQPQPGQPGQPGAEKKKPGADNAADQPTWEERINRLRERLDKTKGEPKDKPANSRTKDQDKVTDVTRAKAQPPEPGKADSEPTGAAAKRERDKKM